MSDHDRARRTAELLWSAWRSGERQPDPPDDVRPRDEFEGMAAQTALEELAGPGYGWKLAATSAAGQAHIRVDGPLPGRLFEQFRYADGDRLPAHDLHMSVVEAEFAFRMGSDVGPEATRDEVLAAVAAMHLAIEVPDSRFTHFERAGAAQVLADDAFAGRFVLGAEVPGWADVDLPAHPVALHVNGQHAADGSGGNVLGDPRAALAWLAGELPRLGRALRAGDIVTTGTTTAPPAIAAGDDVLADFGELGTVRAGLAR